jgi:hypothetical protein
MKPKTETPLIHTHNGEAPVCDSVVETPRAVQPESTGQIDDIESLRLDPSTLKAAQKLWTTVPIKRPNRQEFIRVHPDEDKRLLAALITLEEDRETFLVLPTFVQQVDPQMYAIHTLFLAVNRSKTPFLWPVKTPGQSGKISNWHLSALDGAEAAMKCWVRVSSNKDLGAYEIVEAKHQVGEPEWPKKSFLEIINIAFRNRIISDQDHPLMKKLRGELI